MRKSYLPVLIALTISIIPTASFADTQPTTDEIAKDLKSPAPTLASITNNIEYRTFKGDLPDAGSQTSLIYAIQPVLPFPLDNGNEIIFRPEFPLLFNEPITTFNTSDNPTGFKDADTAIGDISFDLAYGNLGSSNGLISLYGVFVTLPTATNDDVAGDQWLLGPEVAFGITDDLMVSAFLVAHQWDVAGDNKEKLSVTTLEYTLAYGLGDGWQVFTAPTSMTYDWNAGSGNKLTLPIGIGIEKVVILGGTPVALGLFVEKYIEQPDEFGPDIMIQFSFTPVIKNPFL